MTLRTRLFGTIEWNESSLIRFPEGLLGFENCQRFLLIDDETILPFRWLQSVDQPELAFAVIEPRLFLPDYKVPSRVTQAAGIDCDSGHGMLTLTIAVLSRDPRRITVNLAGPLIINAQTLTESRRFLIPAVATPATRSTKT